MIAASAEDSRLHDQGRLAANKIRYLETLKQTFNNASLRSIILDPEINFLEAVKFFLEPLSSSTLPGYTIQTTVWSLLETFPITLDALLSSGLGNLAVFYTRSIQPDRAIKLKAARCLEEWARVVMNRNDDGQGASSSTATAGATTAAAANAVPLQTAVYDPEREARRDARRQKQSRQRLHPSRSSQSQNSAGVGYEGIPSVREAMKPDRAVIPEREFKTYSVVPQSVVVGRERARKGAGGGAGQEGVGGVLARMGKR